jgi:N-methylhydantoinase A
VTAGTTLAVDVGGTFADAVAVYPDGSVLAVKVPSDPSDYAATTWAAVRALAEQAGQSTGALLRDCGEFVQGTTIVTNLMVADRSERVGLITTSGHEDAIIIGRTMQKVAGLSETAASNFALLDKARELVAPSRIRGLHERVDVAGAVVLPLDVAEVELAADSLVALGVTAIAVCLLWSFRNPSHERAAAEAIRRRHPGLFVTASVDLAPVLGEYERAATVVANAYVSGPISEHLDALRGGLAGAGFAGVAYAFQSDGGTMSLDRAVREPVRLLASGPVGGISAARKLGQSLGLRDIITADVGGTTFDVGLIVDGDVELTETPVFGRYHLAMPSFDVVSIGSGGGSVTAVDPDGPILRVGPDSMGAHPGPACYRRGNTRPTVTDADVVLGRIDPDDGGPSGLALDAAAARRAIEEHIARPLAMSVEEAALGIVEVADAQMADLIHKRTVQRGLDPRAFTLLAFGGGGPLHVAGFARELGCDVVVPAFASSFSALGLATADAVVVRRRSVVARTPGEVAGLGSVLDELASAALRELDRRGQDEPPLVRRFASVRHRGQVSSLRVGVRCTETGLDTAHMLAGFERLYQERYGAAASFPELGVEVTTVEVEVRRERLRPAGVARVRPAGGGREPVATRRVHLASGWAPVPVHDLRRLAPDAEIEGPALVRAHGASTLLEPGDRLRVDAAGHQFVSLLPASSSRRLRLDAVAGGPS